MIRHSDGDAVAAARFMERASAQGHRRGRMPRRFELSSATWDAIVEWLVPGRYASPPSGKSYMGVALRFEDSLPFGDVILIPGEPQRLPHVRADASVDYHPVARDECGRLPEMHSVDYRGADGLMTRIRFDLRHRDNGPETERQAAYVENGAMPVWFSGPEF